MLVIGRLAPRWNVPIIAHLSGDDALSDRSVFPTLGSVALTSATEMARATFTYLRLYNWQKIGIVRPTRSYGRLSIHSLTELLKNNKEVEITIMIEIDPYSSVEQIIETGKLTALRQSARIVIVELGLDLNDCTNFMIAVQAAGMKNEEYVYILPWLSHISDYYPWEGAGVDKQLVKRAYENTIYALLVYMSLYDALFLYGLAIRDAYDFTGNDQIYKNGTFIWKKMTGRQFLGMTGQVLINNEAIRVPRYATYQISNGSLRIVVELEAKLDDANKCLLRKTDCSIHVCFSCSSKSFCWTSMC
ncbi:unnamed protein product [Gongylonema pulchrum]|uniref:ANF_receptor domain-containing protein n=1 Tax=Gongylonema pulchrum TaxID=637853 RepID=A0A183CXA8_9BILA|nr:unnamed protein product [Gongylonema pulchrum]